MKSTIAKKYIITGKVQSVGFRPCLYNHAQKIGLKGYICNMNQGVELVLEGETLALQQYWQSLELPPLAQIYKQEEEVIEPQNYADFTIRPNKKQGIITATIMEDIAICSSCLTEVFDTHNRRYLYPFINCTHCGPRASIITALPYERKATEMKSFPLCSHCQQEYTDITDRRFHAEPIACPQCGPAYDVNIEDIARHIQQGEAICIKGVGGFHLMADAHHKKGLPNILALKPKRKKPLAVMVLNIQAAQNYVRLDEVSQKLLLSHKRPIVLAPHIPNSLNSDIYQELDNIGIMLAYAPIHYLLFWQLLGRPKTLDWLKENNNIALIITSANPSGEPLIFDDKKAYKTYKDKTLVVGYNRSIYSPSDDSVIRSGQFPMIVRMGRGFSPLEIPIDYNSPPILAVGSHLKNSIALAYKNKIYVSPYLGSIQTPSTYEHFTQSIQKLTDLLDIQPEYVAHDLHPDFLTTQWAQSQEFPALAFQHHRAHIAAVVAEHHIKEKSIGIALDGFGLGDDGQAWGGEAFYGQVSSWKHVSSLEPLPFIGGDKIAHEPWRMALSMLYSQDLLQTDCYDQEQAAIYYALLQRQSSVLYTSALGRYIEGFTSLAQLGHYQEYEAQAAQKLEAQITALTDKSYFEINAKGQLSFAPLIRYLYNNPKDYNAIATSLTLGLYAWIISLTQKYKSQTIILSGGCLVARYISDNLIAMLQNKGYNVFWPQKLPVGDGNIAIGQVLLACEYTKKGEDLCV
ncbi:MAG: carbamoyltransferase HypF [Alphaproteobacteria bacterium]